MRNAVTRARGRAGLIYVLLLLCLSGSTIYWYLEAERQDAQWMARAAERRAQQDYRSEAAGCAIRFTRGNVDRVDAYRELDWGGPAPELVGSDTDTEGETWVEFHAAGAGTAGGFATERHPLVRQRLWSLYYPDSPSALAELEGRLQVLYEGTEAGWQVRVAVLYTPFPPSRIIPPDTHAAPFLDFAGIAAVRAAPGAELQPLPWTWIDLENTEHPQRANYLQALHSASDYLRNEPDAQRRVINAWHQRHSHFFLVEALRPLADERVIAIRRFGQVVGTQSLNAAAAELSTMMRSLDCTAAPGAP